MLVRQFGTPVNDLPPVEKFTVEYTDKTPPVDVDPATYEVLRHRLWWALITVSETLKKVSGTIVTAEGNDMSTYISLEDGSPVYLGPYVALHSGIADLLISRTIETAGDEIEPGDMILCNDPWMGPVHQPDCAVIAPLFVDGTIFSWVGVTLHQLDMGGIDPGGLCPNAHDAFGEPHIYPAVKLVEHGKMRRDIDRMLRRNSRMPDIVALDMRSMVSGNHAALQELQSLISTYSPEVVRSVMIEIQEDAKRQFRERLQSLPRGQFSGIDRNEVGGADQSLQDDVYEVQCTLRNTGEKLIFDFSGTSKQSGGFANCGYGGLRSACLMSLMESAALNMPWNAGVSSCVEIWTQPGTVNNPTWPAAVSDGITEGAVTTALAASQAVSNWLLASKNMKDRAGANGGNFLGNTLGGIDENGKLWGTLLLDSLVQSYGPTLNRDAIDMAGAPGIPYTQIINVEQNEQHYPLLYLFRRTGRGTGGAGKHRGGNAIEFAFTPHGVDFAYLLLWNHGAEFPNTAPMDGGLPNGANRFLVASVPDLADRMRHGMLPLDFNELGVRVDHLPAKSDRLIVPGDLVLFGAQGTPGFGDPLERDPDLVAKDVATGQYTEDVARCLYGVVLTEANLNGGGDSAGSGTTNTLRADGQATESLRKDYITARLAASRPVMELNDMTTWINTDKLGWDSLLDYLSQAENKAGETILNGNGNHPIDTNEKGVSNGNDVLVSYGDSLQLYSNKDGSYAWKCASCGNTYCDHTGNPKLHSNVVVLPLNSVHPWASTVRLDNQRFFCRIYLCPSCGRSFASEISRPDDPVIPDALLDTEWLEDIAPAGV